MEKYKFGKQEAKEVAKVFAWSFASALIAGLLSALNSGNIPQEFMIYVPLVNSFLYGIKQWLDDNKI